MRRRRAEGWKKKKENSTIEIHFHKTEPNEKKRMRKLIVFARQRKNWRDIEKTRQKFNENKLKRCNKS